MGFIYMLRIQMKQFIKILFEKYEEISLEEHKDPKVLSESSNNKQDIYKNIVECTQIKKRKVLIVFDSMIADMISSKKFNQIVTDLFIRGKKLSISSVFITQSYFKVLADVRLNCTYSKQITFNHLSVINFEDCKTIFLFQ